jgi:hypothetical protein
MRTLRVTYRTILSFILQQTRQAGAFSDLSAGAAGMSPLLSSLRAIAWGGRASHPDAAAAFALVERYAAHITELDCPLESHCDAATNIVLARCVRLEYLTDAHHYASSVWLQLSHLHTLWGVDLTVVSMATMAAALPRLHTLGAFAFQTAVPAAAVAGFFEDLLPRLQVLHYIGGWPQNLHSDAAGSLYAPLPLPQLRTLKLDGFRGHPPPWTRFAAARPSVFWTNDQVIQCWLSPGDGVTAAAASAAVSCSLAAVREFEIVIRSPSLFTPTNIARLLRAAPHIETLFVMAPGVNVDSSWLEQSTHAAFGELVHSKLRRIRVSGLSFMTLPSDCVVRLRQRHFPRLKAVENDGCEYYITPLEAPSPA